MKSYTEQFDKAVRTVTQERGEKYGHPAVNFNRIAAGDIVIDECPDPRVRHALRMIWTKVCRLVETPDHLDSAVDLAGYARTICMINDYGDL